MSIYITGDIHGDPVRFSTGNFPEQKEMTKNDFIIICGDFGLIWDIKESREEKYWLNWFDEKPFTTLFCCGNHENFDRLYQYPVVDFHGGKAHKISDSVYHLMRGEIFNLQGKKFFVFGGASSHDIQDGILDISDPDWHDKARELNNKGKIFFRVKGLSWWPQELPSEEEIRNGNNNLIIHNNEVDFIVTHTPYASAIPLIIDGYSNYKNDLLTGYLELIENTVDYKVWFCGHMHRDKEIHNGNKKTICLYWQIIRIL